ARPWQGKELMMSTDQNGSNVEIQQLTPQPVLSIRGTGRVVDLGEMMRDRIAALADYVQQGGALPAGPPFVRYHTFGETETDFEFGVPVVEPAIGEGRIVAGELPGGTAIATWHLGPHDKLGDAYARIGAWLKDHGREPDGTPWEVYYWMDLSHDRGPSTLADPSSRGTQLIQPIK